MLFQDAYENDATALLSKSIPDINAPTYFHASFGQIAVYFLSQAGDVQSRIPLAEQKDYVEQAAQAAKMAQVVADFIGKAKKSIHIAIYDFELSGQAEALVIGAINQAAQAGISVQMAYNKPAQEKTPEKRGFTGADPAPMGTDMKLTQRGYLNPKVELKAVEEEEEEVAGKKTFTGIEPPAEVEDIEHPSNIMHNKFIVRDGEAVLTGSANFTDGAWGLQENNVVIFEGTKELGGFYETDFNDLWTNTSIKGTGKNASGQATVGAAKVAAAFAPGDGPMITDEIVKVIDGANKRLMIASMVISSVRILESIQSAKTRIPQDIKVLIDQTEMRNAVLGHWRRSKNPASAEKLKLWETVSEGFKGKKSEVYVNGRSDWPHNFMHNKFVVADDTVVTGSFNFSQNAERNAENVVVIQDKNLADAYAMYFDQIYRRYNFN